MDYSLVNITDSRFENISSTILQNVVDFNTLTNGVYTEDSSDQSSSHPSKYNIVDLTNPDTTPREVLTAVSQLIEQEQSGSLFCTLASYYPAEGFIGWHTNSNFNLYNAICTFSDTGDSYFEYKKDGQIVHIQDNAGWYVKKTYWSKETPIAHRAVSNCNRITITFSSKEESIVDNFITKITS